MRITKIQIDHWRNFKSITIAVPDSSSLVCLVGENGTGKSNILELIAGAAHRAGLAPGIELSRGDPFNEPHSFSITLKLANPSGFLGKDFWDSRSSQFTGWDNTITVTSSKTESSSRTDITGGGINPQQADVLVDRLRQLQETNYLHLDADRAYPPLDIQPHYFSEALQRNWESVDMMRGQAFRPTRALYDDWIKYFLGRETQHATRDFAARRIANENHAPDPAFVDPFSQFKDSLRKVLPHLIYTGVDSQQRTILFNSAGTNLRFHQLSGGEREIAFLIGQIERFKLRQGLLMVDEPELHLNPDLLRTWIAFLRDTIAEGQVWIATHSMEAVEVAGKASTFVFERVPDSRIVNSVESLANRPALAVLSSALGSPAFSLVKLRFVFVEGDRSNSERERYHRLCGDDPNLRFMEGGGCQEVAKSVSLVREFGKEMDTPIKVGGIIDRDFRNDNAAREYASSREVFVLPVHEVENLFLNPGGIGFLLRALGRNSDEASAIILSAADQLAGGWIFQRAYANNNRLPEPSPALKKAVWQLSWQSIESNTDALSRAVDQYMNNLESAEAEALKKSLQYSCDTYRQLRTTEPLWMACLGKQVLPIVSGSLGYNSPEVMERALSAAWKKGDLAPAAEIVAVQQYVASLGSK